MSRVGRFLDLFAVRLPTNSFLYRFCKRYVDHYNGNNNSDIRINGELHWMRQTLPQCKTVFDVGANIGEWTALALRLNPAVQVHCFEPSIETFRHLEIQMADDKRVSLNHMGLGDSEGDMTMYMVSARAGTNSLYQRQGVRFTQTQSELVKIGTLDAYCRKQDVTLIDLLKIDVEGYELRVLKGAEYMLSQGNIRRIQFEYGGTFIDARILLKDIFELLISYDYHLFKIYPHELRAVEHYSQSLENFQYQNWVAIK